MRRTTRMTVRSVILVILIVYITASNGQPPRKRKRLGGIAPECVIGLNNDDLPDPQPLLLKPGGSKDVFGFYQPSLDGSVHVYQGQNIHVACPGARNHLSLFPGVKEVYATCHRGSLFIVNQVLRNFSELACRSPTTNVAIDTGESCSNIYLQSTFIDIGFEVGKDFFKLIKVCFNQIGKYTLYSKFDLVPEIGRAEVGDKTPDFRAGSFFRGIGITNLYDKKKQISTFRYIGIKPQYLGANMTKGRLYLARGHLTAKADFVYGSQKDATYYYVNAAPQWQSFNADNWRMIEDNVRLYATRKNMALMVYTGIYGVTTLLNETDVPTELYLYVDDNGNKAVPVPKLFWKVVYHSVSKNGVAILGVNNPYIPANVLGADYRICPDISSKVPWVLLRTTDSEEKGIVYCCEVDELRKNIGTFPDFEVKGLLT